MIEIEIPCVNCQVHPLMALPYSTEDRMNNLNDRFKGGGALPFPVVLKHGNLFLVVSGWDVIQLLKLKEIHRARVLLLNESENAELEWCITKHCQDLDLPWTSNALAINKAKKQLNLADKDLAVRLKIDRSKVTKLIKIASKLSPKLFKLAERKVLSYSDCRRLVTLPFIEQEELAIEAIAKNWDSKRILKKAFPTTQINSPLPFGTIQEISKSRDIKRLEIDISELIGYPVSINPLNDDCSAGSIDYQFFDRSGLIDVLTKLRSGFATGAVPKGRISLTFDSLDGFESLTSGYFDKDM
ncbi:hypothetical protein [Cellvibrio sp. QJXJ]|uniref:hypothetical protein n=1 Tax=Cellvibrio sp. QJXJ TaxID=2964606 RepID=UPI0021C27438|nr:hypothetical protein [Cellvibrio sp. QJXJ]UUA75173.1 hypothetical protein NNX04_22205 [Cellvibrio sp. QJXJ]